MCTIDLGCGLGSQSLRASLTGINTYAYDIDKAAALHLQKLSMYSVNHIRFFQTDLSIKESYNNILPNKIDVAYAQRFIHYLEYTKAIALLTSINKRLRYAKSKIFISFSGLNSEIGLSHPHRATPLEHRHAVAHPDMVKKHGISKPLTPYSREESINLLTEAGFRNVEAKESEFGNVKCIAQKGKEKA